MDSSSLLLETVSTGPFSRPRDVSLIEELVRLTGDNSWEEMRAGGGSLVEATLDAQFKTTPDSDVFT